MIYAPIVIPTLCRYEHLRRCIESLERCKFADETELYIALDYPTKDIHWTGYRQIEKYVKKLRGFKNVIVIKREKNFGPSWNERSACLTALEKYDRVIVTEDDNEFSPNFLVFVNSGLEKYENNRSVYSICGYNYPVCINDYSKDVFFDHNYSAWGFATWKDRYLLTEAMFEKRSYLMNLLRNHPLKKFLQSGMRCSSIVRLLHKERLGDYYITLYQHLNNLYSVFPKYTLVKNWGHDGSGANCTALTDDNKFSKQELVNTSQFDFDFPGVVTDNEYVSSAIRKHFSLSLKEKIKNFILLLIIKLFIIIEGHKR